MQFRDSCSSSMAFALNRTMPAGTLLGNQVNSNIGAIESGLGSRPFSPKPHGGKSFFVKWVFGQVGFHQPLEQLSLLDSCIRYCPQVVKSCLKCVAHACLILPVVYCLGPLFYETCFFPFYSSIHRIFLQNFLVSSYLRNSQFASYLHQFLQQAVLVTVIHRLSGAASTAASLGGKSTKLLQS